MSPTRRRPSTVVPSSRPRTHPGRRPSTRQLVNNASEQHVSSAGIEDVPPEQLERVIRTNVFGYVFMAKVGGASW